MTLSIARVGMAASIAALFLFQTAFAREEKVSLGSVPQAVMDTVKARFGDSHVKGAAKEIEEGKPVYEITLDERGRNVDVTLSPEGTMLLIERTIPAAGLPEPVRQALAHRYPAAAYRTVEEIVEVQDGQERLTSYELLLGTADGAKREVKVTPDGANITEETEEEDVED